jgi:acetyl esterase/lipase
MNAYVQKIREEFGQGDAKRDAGQKTPEDIMRFDDISYGTDDPELQKLDVYRPKDRSGKLPVILSIHGGGWVYGTKDVYQWYCMSLAERGFAVVNYSYRLAPEYRYPASFEDTSTVSQWIIDHAEDYGFDTKHIFGVGDSAGAHMLSLFASALTNPEQPVSYRLPKDFRFCAIALNCGIYDMVKNDQDPLIASFLAEKAGDSAYTEISPVHWITEKFPPCFVMTCYGDFLKDAPQELIPVLQKQQVPFVYRCYGNEENPLGHVFHCNMALKEAAVCNDEECRFFQKFC